jgi:hypothetical protein
MQRKKNASENISGVWDTWNNVVVTNRMVTVSTSDPAKASKGHTPFNVRPYHAQDVIKALQLYQTCFSIQLDQAEWTWKFESPLTDSQPSFHLAEAGGELVGLFPTRTLRLQLDNRVQVVTQAQDVCIHPDYRGGAILRALFQANEASERRAGIPFLFGFPTGDHMKVGSRIFGYREMFRLLVWRRPLVRGIRLQARLRSQWLREKAYTAGVIFQKLRTPPKSLLSGETVQMVDLVQFDESIDCLWNQVRSQIRFAVVRDAAYLTWRYMKRPGKLFQVLGAIRDGRVVGYCIFRDDLVRPGCWRVGVLMDLVATDLMAAIYLVEAALTRMRAARCGYVLALAHPESPTAPILAATGFTPDLSAGDVIFACRPYDASLDLSSLQQPADWLLTYGDTDHMG